MSNPDDTEFYTFPADVTFSLPDMYPLGTTWKGYEIEAPGTRLHKKSYFVPHEVESGSQNVELEISLQVRLPISQVKATLISQYSKKNGTWNSRYFGNAPAGGSTTIYTGYARTNPNEESTITSMEVPSELAPSILEEMSFFVGNEIPPVLQGRVQDLTAVSQEIVQAQFTKGAVEKTWNTPTSSASAWLLREHCIQLMNEV